MEKIEIFKKSLQSVSPSEIAHAFLKLLHTEGHNHFEEAVTQYTHAVQSAYWAAQTGADSYLITAALLHDIGHLLHDETYQDGTYHEADHLHETLAADLLAAYFPERVTAPIRNHVLAKRYLVSTEEDYFERLSPASCDSFMLQGGKMRVSEIEAFEALPYFSESVLLRRWDDMSKDTQLEVPPAETYFKDILASIQPS